MKLFKRIFSLVCVLVLCMSMFAMPADALSYTTVTPGKTIALKTEETYSSSSGYKETAHYYKLTLTTDSVVTFKWSNNTKNNVSIDIYANSTRTKWVDDISTYNKVSGSEKLALSKGTYYISMYDGWSNYSYTPTGKVTISVRDVADYNKTNYCRAKARTLSAGTTIGIPQTSRYSYGRWYKITLTKSQRIHVYSNERFITIYTSSLSDLSTTHSYNSNTDIYTLTTDKQAAGTYYIYVPETTYFGQYNRLGDYITLKWN